MDKILNLIESVSEGFPSYFYLSASFLLNTSKSFSGFNLSIVGDVVLLFYVHGKKI